MAKYQRLIKICIVGISCLSLMVAWMGGCAQKKGLKDVQDPFYEQWRVKAEEAKGTSSVEPPPIDEKPFEIASAAGEEEEGAPEAPKPLPTRKISLKMNDINVAVLLRALARAADQNIILNEKVTGKVNINIHQAPWNQVFKGILRSNGLSYAWEGDIIRIMTAEDMDADIRSRAREQALKLTQTPLTRIVSVKFSEADSLKTNLEKFITVDRGGKQTGSILVDVHTNSLIIQAIRPDMDRILAIIKKLDRPTPQVLIEAIIVEANKDVARELGIQWGGVYAGKSGDKRVIVGGQQGQVPPNFTDTGNNVDVTSGSVINLPAQALGGFNPMTLGLVYTRVGEYLLSTQLSALQNQGKVNILSSPSITTLDNNPAEIESGTDIPFQSVEDGEVKVEYKKATLKLVVTPHVIDGDTIKLNIEVNKDEPGDTVVGINPTIITKKAKTNVIQNDGQTIVIGGLSKEKNIRSNTGTPFLEDIPGLGYLFKHKGSSDNLEELIIFITPHILKPRATGSKP